MAKNVHSLQAHPPHMSPARRPPLWDDSDAQVGEGTQIQLVSLGLNIGRLPLIKRHGLTGK